MVPRWDENSYVFISIFRFRSAAATHYPVKISITGDCSGQPIVEQSLQVLEGTNLGKLTVSFLKARGIPFEGSEEGIKSIFGSPTGLEALQVLPQNEDYMRAFGWCYTVNSHLALVYANKILVDRPGIHIHWVGAYSLFYRNDIQGEMCRHAWRIPQNIACKAYQRPR